MEYIRHILFGIYMMFHVTKCAVDCGPPAYSVSIDMPCAELDLDSVVSPADNLQGAMIVYPCKSLLIRTSAKRDYCPVELCEASGTWRPADVSCGSTECYQTDSTTYKGRRICTSTGIMCQRWDSQSPHAHNYTVDGLFPEGNMTAAGSYCRDPGGSRGQPWCYTVDPNVPWQLCDVPNCIDVTISQGTCPGDYCGDLMAAVVTDNQCIEVDPVSSSYPRNVNANVTNTCTSLLSGFTSVISYCPVRTCLADSHWTNNSLSCGVNECYTAGQSAQYTGRRMCTVTGRTCQSWMTQSPHAHPYNTLASFPDTSVSALGSHCRDPGAKGQPWCYTTDPGVEWELCGLPECSTLLVTSGTCPPTTTSSTGSTVLTPAQTTVAPTPFPDVRYQRVFADRVGVQLQTTLSNIRSATSCCRRCHQMPSCIMVVHDVPSEACSLYAEDAGSVSPVDCGALKCFVLQSQV